MNVPAHLYPVVVVQDRYGGCYSHGEWLALSGADERILDGQTRLAFVLDGDGGPSDGDPEAMNFWDDPPTWIAVGATPDEAVARLIDGNG